MHGHDQPPRHKWWILPNWPRQRPRWHGWWGGGDFWKDWWTAWRRLIASLLALALAAGVASILGPVYERLTCHAAIFGSDIWRKDGECVGTSTGRYAFRRPEVNAVMRKIADQNRNARDGSCGKNSKAVTVGALVTLTSKDAGGRAVDQLEGIAAAQAKANEDKANCSHPVRVRVGQMGASEQAATSVARLLADDGVVGVVGMGLSFQQSADAAQVLAARHIPMVAPVITAEGFDKNGSADDGPDFRGCNPGATYKNGVGQGFFYRVAYRNAVQINRLAEYFNPNKNRVNFIMTPVTMDDPYTCTALPLLHRRFGNVQEVRFDPTDPTTVRQSAQRICSSPGAVNVLYAARARDLPTFLTRTADLSANGQCQFSSITVMSTSDAARMRSQETDTDVEQQRNAALNAAMFRNGKVRLVYTPLADPDLLARSSSPAFTALKQEFADLGFAAGHLDSGWAVNGYDAMLTVATALNSLSAGQKVTPTEVNTAIGGFSKGGQSVAGAGGNITFDNNGNRDDSVPPVVRLCPAKTPGQAPLTVQLLSGHEKCP